jgi:hypothetical protein
MRILLLPSLAALALLAGCGAPEEALVPISDEARAAQPPRLLPTARFDDATASAGPDAERLGDEAASLSARAEALRRRSDALAGPLIDPAVRPRLEAATAGGG